MNSDHVDVRPVQRSGSAAGWDSVSCRMAMMTDIDRAVNERLAESDLRYTSGRKAIVTGLRLADRPVTLPELLDLAPALTQSSAYRNLSLMEEAGVIRRLLHGGDHAHFELAEELTEHHHHLICESCGLVRDITLDAGLEQTLDRAFARIADAEGFVPRHHAIDVYGRCAGCS